MLKAQVIGLGAAGNKATVELIKNGSVTTNQCLIINTNQKDMPPAYKENGGKWAEIGKNLGGCGQERNKGREVAIEALQSGDMQLDEFLDLDSDLIVLITSTEGGTGSGSAPIVAQYIKEVHNLNVLIFAITGFEQFPRAIWNTIEFFKDLKQADAYHIEILRNKNFLADNRNNRIKAEQACNQEICRRFDILIGRNFKPSEQNIDNRDLLKLSTEPGWGNVEFRLVEEKIKNDSQFNDIIRDMIDETKSFDVVEGSEKKMGVVLSLSESEFKNVNFAFDEIVDKYGTPFDDIYKQFQTNDAEHPRCIAFITTGMHLPIEEFEELYAKAEDETSKVNTTEDDFFNKVGQMQNQSDQFNFKEDTRTVDQRAQDARKAKNSFFAQFGSAPKAEGKSEESSTQKVREMKKDMSNM